MFKPMFKPMFTMQKTNVQPMFNIGKPVLKLTG